MNAFFPPAGDQLFVELICLVGFGGPDIRRPTASPGVSVDDTEADLKYMAEKVPNLRIFDDENGVMNRSVLDVGGSILAVSQFTLYGDARGGRRPSYFRAASIQSDDKTSISTLHLTLDVHSREEMNKVIQALRNKSDILDVYRATK